jgi:TolB protein
MIAFTANRLGRAGIWVVNVDGTGLRSVVDLPGADELPSWSADNTRIAFETDDAGGEEIYTIRIDGTDLRQITNHRASDYCQAWRQPAPPAKPDA